jgi:hypoxanthine phosphoribosyltransferase
MAASFFMAYSFLLRRLSLLRTRRAAGSTAAAVGQQALGIGRIRARCYPGWRVREIADFQADSTKEPPRFANQAERECAKILDFYGVPWEYEPRTFVLEEGEDGRVIEAFTPDFYLPEQQLFLEITVMKQRLVTRKNRKLRKLRERYPDVNVKLFYKRDIERLAQRYRLDLAS